MSGSASGGVHRSFGKVWYGGSAPAKARRQLSKPTSPPPRVECFGRRRLDNGRTRRGFRVRYSVVQDGYGLSQATASFVCSARSKTQMRRLIFDMMRWIRLHPCLFDWQQFFFCVLCLMFCPTRHVYFIKRRAGQPIDAVGCQERPGKYYSARRTQDYSSHD